MYYSNKNFYFKTNDFFKNVDIEVYNLSGYKLKFEKLNVNDNHFVLPCELPLGFYLVKIKSDDFVLQKKVLIN